MLDITNTAAINKAFTVFTDISMKSKELFLNGELSLQERTATDFFYTLSGLEALLKGEEPAECICSRIDEEMEAFDKMCEEAPFKLFKFGEVLAELEELQKLIED